MALQNLTIVGLLYFIMCEDPTWIEIHWNSICLMAESHMTFTLHLGACDHTTWFLEVFWDSLGHFFWALTISWSRLQAFVWSGPQNMPCQSSSIEPFKVHVWVLFGLFSMFSNFYHLDSQNKTCVALKNLWWSISSKKWIKIHCSPNSVMVIGSPWLLISFNWIHRSSQMCPLLSAKQLIKLKV